MNCLLLSITAACPFMRTILFCTATQSAAQSSIEDLENALNEDLSKIALWPNRNKLTLNIEKIKSMLIWSDRKLYVLPLLYLSQHLIKKLRELHTLSTWG